MFDVRPQSEFIRITEKSGSSKTQRQAINSEKRKIKKYNSKRRNRSETKGGLSFAR